MGKKFYFIYFIFLYLLSCSGPNSQNVGNIHVAEPPTSNPFTVSVEGLDKTAWAYQGSINKDPDLTGVIIFEKQGLELTYLEHEGNIKEATNYLIIEKMTKTDRPVKIIKFDDKDAYIRENADSKDFFRFENESEGSWITLDSQGNIAYTYTLSRIPFTSISSQAPDWSEETLRGQKWYSKIGYKFPLRFENEDFSNKVVPHFPTERHFPPFPSAEAAFNTIKLNANTGTIEEIDNKQHTVTLEWQGAKWKLFFADADMAGMKMLSAPSGSENQKRCPLPIIDSKTVYIYYRYNK